MNPFIGRPYNTWMPSVGLAMIVQRPAPEGSSVFSFSLGSLLLREVHKAEQAVLRFYEIIIFVLAGLKAQIWSGIPPPATSMAQIRLPASDGIKYDGVPVTIVEKMCGVQYMKCLSFQLVPRWRSYRSIHIAE